MERSSHIGSLDSAGSGLLRAHAVKRALQLVVSLTITAACFWWTFRDVDWAMMWASLKSAQYIWLLPYLGILTVIHVARTLRWGNLLSPLEKVKFKPLNEASGIGFMMLLLLPFRLGEFARPYLIADRSQIRRSAAMTSVVFERIVDGLVIAFMLRGLLFFVPGDTADIRWIRFGANMMFAIFGGGLLFLIFAAWQHERAVRLIGGTFGRISASLGERVAHVVDGFVGATKQLPDVPNMVGFFFWTAVYWVLNGVGVTMLANAFDCHGATGTCSPLHISLFQGYVVLAVLVVGLTIPGAPGGAGIFQAAIKLGLSLFVPTAAVLSSGVAYANVLWVVQMLQQILFGVILMVLSNRSFTDITGKMQKDDAPKDDARKADVAA